VLFDYPCLFISSGNKFAPISMKTSLEKPKLYESFCDLNFDQNQKAKKKSFSSIIVFVSSRLLLPYNVIHCWGSISPRSSVSLCEKAHIPSNDAPIISSPSSSSSNEDEEKGCTVLFRSFSDRQNTKERSTTINNLFEKRSSSFSSRFNCCRYRVRFIPTKKPQKQSHLSLCTEEEEGE